MAQTFGALATRHLKTSTGKADSRTKLIRAVCAAARAAQMDDDDRKAIQHQLTGKASLKDMTPAEMGKVLDHLNGGKPRSSAKPHIGKVKALWWTCYWLGLIDEPNDKALDGFVQRQTGIASLRFLDHRHAPSVIEALKDRARKAGVVWPTAERVTALLPHNPGLTLPRLERHAVLAVLWDKLRDLQIVWGMDYVSYVQRSAGLSLNHWMWTETQLDLAIKALGKQLRRGLNKASRDEA